MGNGDKPIYIRDEIHHALKLEAASRYITMGKVFEEIYERDKATQAKEKQKPKKK